jgi:hypothetical protein
MEGLAPPCYLVDGNHGHHAGRIGSFVREPGRGCQCEARERPDRPVFYILEQIRLTFHIVREPPLV